MKLRFRHALFLPLALSAGLSTTACTDDNAFEDAGEAVDEAVDDAGDAIEDAGDKVEDAVDDIDDAK